MKKLVQRLTLAVLMFVMGMLSAKAIGWPSNYQGVMLQGFYWDSYTDSNWANLEKQADELSQYFSLIWVPNSAKSAGQPTMGYMPIYWFTNHNSSFGTESQLRSMIKTFKAKGTGIIADVVVNHRVGISDWADFPTETWNGKTYTMGAADVCRTDEWGKGTGANDTGEDFDGARDLDHTRANVQNSIKDYCKFLLTDMGYAGVRYDMVKGYGGQFTKIYNQANNITFSVGEYWDGSYDAVKAWIEATGKTSAAFDFPFKYAVNEAFGSGDLTKLVWKANGDNNQPAGMIHFGYSQYAVTFIDNHDTYRDGSKFNGNVLAANAFMLMSPGTPCVFLPHYKANKAAIQTLINIRNSAGIHNNSAVKVLKSTSNCYMAEVTGTKGTVVVKIGSAMDSPSGYSTSDIKASGNDYCVWSKVGVNPNPDPNPNPNPNPETITVYYDNSVTSWSTVNCYSYDDNGDNNGAWPGKAMTKVEGNIYSATLPAGSNVVFNNGSAQTVNVMGVQDKHLYKGLAETETGEFGNQCNKVEDCGEYGNNPNPNPNPNPDNLTIYYDNSVTSWSTVNCYSYDDNGDNNGAWPGKAMTKVEGNIYSATLPAGSNVVFNNGSAQTVNVMGVQDKHLYKGLAETETGEFGNQCNKVEDCGIYGNNPNPNPNPDPDPDNMPEKLYLVGNLHGSHWDVSVPVTMDKDAHLMVAKVTLEALDSNTKAYFTFITVPGGAPDDWDTVNNSDRWGAPSKDFAIEPEVESPMTKYPVNISAMGAESWMVDPGTYYVAANFKNNTVLVSKNPITSSGVETIATDDEDATPVYYNLQGVRILNPTQGLYIEVRGNKARKVLVK